MAPVQSRKKQKVLMPITIHTFEAILNYLISVRTINRKFIRNIQELLSVMDERPYERDDYSMFVINAISFVAKIRDDGVNNLNYIRTSIEQSDLDVNFVNQMYQNLSMSTEDMSKEEYENLSITVADFVDYAYIYYARPDIMRLYDELMNVDGRLSTEVIHNLKETFENVLSKIRIADSTRDSENTICLDSKQNRSLKNEVGRIYDKITDPSNTFVVGLKELNRFLNGGYQRGRMYMYYAPTNSFKSGILLYNALWIMQFNPNIKPKFPNKKLAILLINMENSVDETMDRIHGIYTGGQVDPRSITKEEYLKQWDDIFASLDTNFRLYIRYKSPGSTSVDIQTMVDELEEDENCEIAAVIIDHLGNMGKLDKNVDDRRGLINTTYELSDWAKRSDRLLISAMHTNSGFDDTLAEAIQNGKANLVRMMGRHCIADAKYIDRAVDQSIYLLKERSSYDGQWYIGFKYEKVRSKKSNGSNVFYHKLENEITLRYDTGLNGCFSFPCIPGTENSIQIAQAEANGMNQMGNVTPIQASSVMPSHPIQSSQPFGNGGNNIQSQISKKMSQPIPMSFNQQTTFNINEVGNNTVVENLNEMIDSIDSDDFADDIPDLLISNVAEDTGEEFNDSDFVVESQKDESLFVEG